MRHCYKIIQDIIPIGKIIDTNECIAHERVGRCKELRNLFEMIYNFSADFNWPVSYLFLGIIPDFVSLQPNIIRRVLYYSRRLVLKYKSRQFDFNVEGNYFIDFILEKSRFCVQKDLKTELPNRGKSSFFFESLKDCNEYASKSNFKGEIFIVKVEFVETDLLFLFDNNLISDFSNCKISVDYLNQAKLYLNGGKSHNPLMEVVFQGKYKIISYESLVDNC